MTDHVAQVAVHREPVWRERADYIIRAVIEDPGSTGVTTEQLWARQIDDGRFELCCIPFFLYDIALGDEVAIDEGSWVTKVVRPSGRWVFRVHFTASQFARRDEVVSGLIERGALVEWSSPSMFAVDAVDELHAQLVADYLWAGMSADVLTYETGRTA
jgi:hypothetical protein